MKKFHKWSGCVVGAPGILFLCILMSILLSSHRLFAAGTMMDLGNLGGTEGGANCINNAGQVLGYSETSFGEGHAFLYSNGIMTDLGTLGEKFSDAWSLNDSGQVAGVSYTSQGDYRAFLYSNGTMTDLGTLGGPSSSAYGINNAGQVIGTSMTSPFGPTHAFLYSNGIMTDLGTLGGPSSYAYGINDSEQIIGSADTSSGGYHAFLYSNGIMTDLGTLGGTLSFSNDINNAGQVVGSALTSFGEYRAFLYSNGTMIDLGTLGGNYSEAYYINDAGQVAGQARTTSGEDHAFLYSNGTMTDLGTLGGNYSCPNQINKAGQVVGWATTSSGVAHAFLYSNGIMTDLGTLGGPSSTANGINDSGQVVGSAYTTSGEQHAFLYDPTPIVSPSLQVLEPNGGDTLYKGTDYNRIRWEWSNYTGSVRIDLYYDNAYFYTLYEVAPVESGTQGLTFRTQTGWPSGDKYKIVISTADNQVSDSSDSPFTILSFPTSEAVYHLISTSWAQEGPYIYSYDSNYNQIDENYHVGCAALAIGQLINYYLKDYRVGWLENMLTNTYVYPSFTRFSGTYKKGKPVFERADHQQIHIAGYGTKSSYVKSIKTTEDPGALDLRVFLWYVALGLDSGFTEIVGASGETGVNIADISLFMKKDYDAVPSLLRDRFRFKSSVSYYGYMRSLGAAKQLIIDSLKAKQPLLVALNNKSGGSHWALIDGYEILLDGTFNVYMNFGWGNVDGENNIAYPTTGEIVIKPGKVLHGGTFNSFDLFQGAAPINY